MNDGGSPRPPNSPSSSNGAAQNHGPSPTVTLPTALTTASAATLTPPSVAADAEPRPPFRLATVAPRPAPTLPSANEVACGAGRGIAKIPVGRKTAPLLVAAVQEIEADRAGHDGNHGVAYPEAAALFGKPGLHAATGFQPECRAARERDGIDLLHGVDRIEQRALADAGAAAAHIHRGHRGPIENHRGDARRQGGIVGMTDTDARDIRQQVVQRSSVSSRSYRRDPHEPFGLTSV